MIELRWVWHDMKDGMPPTGSICPNGLMFQKLQFRAWRETALSAGWSGWKDVPHVGMPDNRARGE